MQDFLQLAHDRYSCRKISDKPVEKEKLDKIIEAAIISPTAVNSQSEHLFVLQGDEAVEKISAATKFTFGAKTFIVLGMKAEGSFSRPFDKKYFGDIDAGIIAASILFAVKDLGLDTTYVGYFDPAKMKENFPIMQEYDLVALFPIGYAADDAKPSDRHAKRKSVDEVVTII